jgi:hypothetical protein
VPLGPFLTFSGRTAAPRISADLRTVLAAHVALQFVDRRCFRPTDDVQGHSLMGAAAKAASVQRIAKAGEGWAGPWKASMRLFQASCRPACAHRLHAPLKRAQRPRKALS